MYAYVCTDQCRPWIVAMSICRRDMEVVASRHAESFGRIVKIGVYEYWDHVEQLNEAAARQIDKEEREAHEELCRLYDDGYQEPSDD